MASSQADRPNSSPEERYRLLFENSPIPMWTFERETLRFLTVNHAAVRHYGYSHDEFIAMTLADIRPPEDVGELREAIDRGPETKVWRHRKKNGSVINVEVHASDVVVDGVSVRLVLVNDVTERERVQAALRKTENQLRHAQKMEAIGRLAGGVAHDFNNVLTVIKSYACILEDTIAADDSRHDDVVEIRRAAERATEITRQLLTLSRHSPVVAKPTSIDEVVAGFHPMLLRLLGDQITLSIRRSSVPNVVVDPGQLEQVLMNFAVNARDAMPDGGRLTIESQASHLDAETAPLQGLQPGNYAQLVVTDTGIGMDSETQRRVFDPFFTTKEAGKGTGLGLSIVHGIVTQAGGTINLYSELGHGTSFRVWLPVTDATVATATVVATELRTSLPSWRVLVVDDQPEVRKVAKRILEEGGCTVVEAATATEARNICVRHEDPIDLVLLDVVLPDGRGDQLVGQLRDLRPAMRVLQMSGFPEAALTPPTVGSISVLAKPFSPAQLRAAVAGVASLDAATASGDPVVSSAGAAPKRALVADDDAEFRRAVVRMLRRAGFEVTEVDSGFAAITKLEASSFDVVVSDVHMPDGGGLDLLRAVRRIDLDVPVILMSGQPSLEAAAAAVEYGAFRYLTKPLDTVAFTKIVQHAARAFALARLRREAFTVSGHDGGIADRAGLEVRFDQAIDGMWMAFQPILDAKTGVLFGVEALMRSKEPSIPSPPALLDAATQLGRLPILGRRVRSLSALAMASRRDDTALFVNLHPEDLFDAHLIDETQPLTAMASRVVLEVTERTSLESSSALTTRIEHLRKLGFRLAVDDIGAGYSGLTSFTELMPEIVKIDMSLVRDVHRNTLKQRTIEALCRLCHEVGTTVVGEGVETLDERDALVALGCDLLQGYLLGRPQAELPR